MRVIALCAAVAQFSALVSTASAAEARALTDADFEHLTQASTGATTGDWFVKFYAPWCGHCKNMAPAWDRLAGELDGEINVAKVDATVNQQVARRFGVRGYPSLYFLRQGVMYEYSGDRSVESMAEFARGGYAKEGITSRPVPAPPTFVEQAWSSVKDMDRDIHQRFGIWSTITIAVAAAAVGIAIGAVITALVVVNDSKAPARRAATAAAGAAVGAAAAASGAAGSTRAKAE